MGYELDLDSANSTVESASGVTDDLRSAFQGGHEAAVNIDAVLSHSDAVSGALLSLRGEVLYRFDEVVSSTTGHNISATGEALTVYRDGDEEMLSRAEREDPRTQEGL